MSVQRYVTKKNGVVRYRARVKANGREVATRVFDRRADAVAWERDQSNRLRRGDWVDPRRGRVTTGAIAESWLATRQSVKRRTREADNLTWRHHVSPTFADRPLSTITAAEVSEWLSDLLRTGRSVSTAKRALAVLRGVLDHAVADDRLTRNVARSVRAPRGGTTREGQALTEFELHALAAACHGPLAEVALLLGYTGLRWGELAGLKVGDQISVPGRGLRLQRAVLTGADGKLFVDTLKNNRARSVPLPAPAAEIIDRRCAGRATGEWMFATAAGTPLREGNWKRSVRWPDAKQAIGRPTLRVHDLRHSAASIWIGAGADPKVVQRVLGHATATMTMDLYGHLIDRNLWDNAKRIGGTLGASELRESEDGHA